jgi:hypothetical protein
VAPAAGPPRFVDSSFMTVSSYCCHRILLGWEC